MRHRPRESDALGVQAIECGRLQAVAAAQPLGDEMDHVAAEELQRAPQDHGGGDAVDVVVAVHRDALALRQRAFESLDGAVHVGQPHRIEQVIERRFQEA